MLETLETNINYNTLRNAFPHIAERLQVFWGHPEFFNYINNLIYDTRDGGRKGFPPEIFMALHQLAEDHFQVFPHLRPKTKESWGW